MKSLFWLIILSIVPAYFFPKTVLGLWVAIALIYMGIFCYVLVEVLSPNYPFRSLPYWHKDAFYEWLKVVYQGDRVSVNQVMDNIKQNEGNGVFKNTSAEMCLADVFVYFDNPNIYLYSRENRTVHFYEQCQKWATDFECEFKFMGDMNDFWDLYDFAKSEFLKNGIHLYDIRMIEFRIYDGVMCDCQKVIIVAIPDKWQHRFEFVCDEWELCRWELENIRRFDEFIDNYIGVSET